jgi:hypothetical protein
VQVPERTLYKVLMAFWHLERKLEEKRPWKPKERKKESQRKREEIVTTTEREEENRGETKPKEFGNAMKLQLPKMLTTSK